MAATVIIERHLGAGIAGGGTTQTDITSINTRCHTDDIHSTAGTTFPIPIPAAGTNYSFWVSTRLQATTSPSGTIDNLRWYTDGANGFGTGVTCKGFEAFTGANDGYRIATGTAGTTGTQLTTGNHTGLDGAPVDVFTFTVGSPSALDGSITNPTIGNFGDFFVYQIEVGATAGPGATPAETFTWKYDET